MSRNRDFKRLVRRRMRKTGESYTAARAHFVHARAAARRTSTSSSGGSAMMPFEYFTEPAKQALMTAQSEAVMTQSGYIGTRHLLLALSADPESVAGRVLAGLSVRDASLRAALDRLPPEQEPRLDAELAPTERVKRVIEFAFTEARRSDGSRAVGTGELLVSVVLEGSGAGARALSELGVTQERVRAEVERLVAAGLAPEPSEVGPVRPLAQSREVTAVLNSAQRIARQEQAQVLELDHLIRAMAER
jgi:ATP-dependent Clp protease ATP-binding subunit ClpC